MTCESWWSRRATCRRRTSFPAGRRGRGRRTGYAVYQIDERLADPAPRNILVVDDVLTARTHFAGIKRRLRERFSTMGNIISCFYARRAVETLSEDE